MKLKEDLVRKDNFLMNLRTLTQHLAKGKGHLKSSHFLAVMPADPPPPPPYNLTTFGRILLDVEKNVVTKLLNFFR